MLTDFFCCMGAVLLQLFVALAVIPKTRRGGESQLSSGEVCRLTGRTREGKGLSSAFLASVIYDGFVVSSL